MIRLLLRFFGLFILAGAFAALVVDGTRSIAAGVVTVLPFGRALAAVSPDALPKLRHWIEPHIPLLWDPALVSLFLLPSWVVLGLVGLCLLAMTRRPAPKIGYSRR